MKKSLFNLGLLGLAVLTMLSACSKDSTGPDGEGNNNEITVGSGVMALKANNSQVVFEDIAGTIFIPGNAVSAYGTSTNSLSGFALVLNDPDGIRPGSYPIADYNTATGLQKFFTCAYSQIVSLDSAL
nr:hypothetical protein [Calditrichia bacterium]